MKKALLIIVIPFIITAAFFALAALIGCFIYWSWTPMHTLWDFTNSEYDMGRGGFLMSWFIVSMPFMTHEMNKSMDRDNKKMEERIDIQRAKLEKLKALQS